MLRLLLGLLPVLALSAFNMAEGDDDDADDDATEDDGDTGDATGEKSGDRTFTQSDIDTIIANEKRKLERKVEKDLRDKVRQELEAEQKRKQAEEAQEYQPLYEQTLSEKADLEQRLDETVTQYQQRIVRSEVRVAASAASFHDPDDAYNLLDYAAIEFDDDGEPTNVEKLIQQLATKKPHLIKSESDRRSVEHIRSNGGPKTKEDIKNKYLQQAGRRR